MASSNAWIRWISVSILASWLSSRESSLRACRWAADAVVAALEVAAAGLAVVLAVAVAAMAEQLAELDEAVFHVAATDMAEAEFADAGRVDQVAAAREVEKARRGGGVGAFAGHLGQRADTGIDARQQAVDQR